MGRQLRTLRERNNINQAQAARIAETSPQTYGRLEDGRITKVTDMLLNTLANAYRAGDEERRLLLELAQEIRTSTASGGSWWRGYDDAIAKGFDHYLALEDAANWVTSWQTNLIPGLLQTRDYRRAIAWVGLPDSSSEEIERILDVVMRRQGLLDRDGFRFEALLTEAVLRSYRVGGPSVMGGQLNHLLERSESHGVQIRIVPSSEDRPIGLSAGAFVLFSFPPLPTSKLQEPPVAYMEGLSGGLYVEHASEVEKFSREAERIRHVALSTSESRDLMLEISKEYR
ncbi:helix-turn-helix domain-containing protein [Nocardia sp. NBC_01329]|uniref:helix-turn-helix domain-containing protein n=1 Tax=Nocardia sp. NBC_01329 TaxID=2903594 RepID=UPI002E0D7BE5|nr:helix-turn-helix domain-containing protein [Nocardia sp. NBC_01329]